MKYLIKKGRTSFIALIFIEDSSKTDGSGLTGLTSGSSGLVCYRARTDDGNAGGTAISLSGGTRGTWSSGGFVEKDSANMPGWYELGIPNAAIATGSDICGIVLKGAANMASLPIEIQLVDFDPQNSNLGLSNVSANVAQWNGSNVSAPATAGIPEVNVKNINNVSASGVTTINANQGTTQPINFTGTAGSALAKSDMVDVAGSAVATGTAQIGVNVVNAGGTAWASGSLTSGVFAAGAVNRAALAADTGLQPARSNTAQAGAASTITLDASASATDSFYKGMLVYLTGGTGVGQVRIVTAYVGATKVATVSPSWATNPDNTSTFALRPVGPADLEAIVGAAVSTGSAQLGVNAVNIGGTSQTGADLGSVTPAIKTQTDKMAFTVTNQIDANVLDWKSATAPAMTGDAYARLGAPAGASVSADIAALFTTALTESYATNGSAPTVAQALCMIQQMLGDFSISGTTLTVNKKDHTTAAATFTLNDATSPTSLTRAT